MKTFLKGTPTLTGEPARKLLKEVEENNRKAEEFMKNHHEEYKKLMKEREEFLNKILSKANL